MFNLKWGLFPAIAAFVIALILSLTAQTGFFIALFRAAIFAALFFGVGVGLFYVIKNFIPELLETEDEASEAVANIFSTEQPGSRVNISLDESTAGAAVPEGGAIDEVGNFSELVIGGNKAAAKSKDIDQNPSSGYTGGEIPSAFGEDEAESESSDVGDFIMNFGSFDFESGAESGGSYSDSDSVPERRNTGSKPVPFEGDYNPKEIAAGIRTVLEKDKKG